MLFPIFSVSGVTVIKQGMVTLPEKGEIVLRFGQAHDVLVTQTNKPLRYYSLQDANKLTLVWEKTMPEELDWNCFMYTTPSGKFITSDFREKFVFDRNFNLLSKHKVPGEILGVMGDDYFVACDGYTASSLLRRVVTEHGVLRLSRRELATPEKKTFALSIPAEGGYKQGDEIHAACTKDGHTAVVAFRQSYVDFYSPTGQCSL